ncbi:MAG: hypothetical protein KF841_15890 [Phycisphaerae bacterium]|nr:hypothetical protein [Phycisphaerae bacterium]
MRFRNVLVTAGALAVSTMMGCSENKLTRQNYDLIRVGSSQKEEVKSALGERHLIDRGAQWEYDDESRHISVWFEFDKSGVVTRKQWWSGDGGLEHDSQAGPEGETIYEGKGATTIDR